MPRPDRGGTHADDLTDALAEFERLGLEDPMEHGRQKLIAFLGYVALGSPDTRFIVFSRGSFAEEAVVATALGLR